MSGFLLGLVVLGGSAHGVQRSLKVLGPRLYSGLKLGVWRGGGGVRRKVFRVSKYSDARVDGAAEIIWHPLIQQLSFKLVGLPSLEGYSGVFGAVSQPSLNRIMGVLWFCDQLLKISTST